MTIVPEDIDTGWKIGSIFAPLLAAIGISKWAHKNHDKRITALESGKQDKVACENLQAACPMVLQVGIMNATLISLKDDQRQMIDDIKSEFKAHHDLHLEIARDMGGLSCVKDK